MAPIFFSITLSSDSHYCDVIRILLTVKTFHLDANAIVSKFLKLFPESFKDILCDLLCVCVCQPFNRDEDC